MPRRALVTGASGTIGRQLVQTLTANGWQVNACSRESQPRAGRNNDNAVQWFVAQPVTDCRGKLLTDAWQPPASSFADVDTVFHLAGIAHQHHRISQASYRHANVDASVAIASSAVNSGVRRLVFVSSIAALGQQSGQEPFTPYSKPQPASAYGLSKWQAEQQLSQQLATSQTKLTIVRPPLVYGENPKGNLRALIRLIGTGLPLPLAGLRNCRALISSANLTNLLIQSVDDSRTENRTLMPADVHWATPELIRHIADAMQKPARLFSLPALLLDWVSALPVIGQRTGPLFQSLSQTDHYLTRTIGWSPPHPPAHGIASMVNSVTQCS